MDRFQRIVRFTFVIVFMCTMTAAWAQSGDNLFMEGQKLQQAMTIAAQNQAIKKFKAAKLAYTNTDKKKMCDNQIAICNNNIRIIKRGGGGKGGKVINNPEPAPTKFSLSEKNVVFDGNKSGMFNVKVEAVNTDWNFSVLAGVNGMDNFIKVTRSNDAKSLDISVEANDKTLSREQVINVVSGDKNEEIRVRQEGKTVTLSTEENQLEFGLKGGKKSMEVYTNSDSIIASNYNQTWYIESKPAWINIEVEVNKKQGIFGKFSSAVKKAVSGSAKAADDEDTKTTDITIVAKPVDKKSPEYTKGRKGEIVFASQNQRYTLTIVQQK